MEGRSFAAHDSRQLRYRFPFGAVTEGERITLNIDCGAGVRNAKLRIWTEGRECIEHGVRTDAGFGFTFYAGTIWYAVAPSAALGVSNSRSYTVICQEFGSCVNIRLPPQPSGDSLPSI